MTRSSQNYFFLAFLSIVIILGIFIFLPFLAPLVLALAFTVIFMPLHQRVLKKFFNGREKSSLGAVVTLVILAVLVFVPLTFVAIKIFDEVGQMYAILADHSLNSRISGVISNVFGSYDVVDLLRQAAQWAVSNMNAIFGKLSKIVIEFFVMFLALFYLLRDGRELKRQLIEISPLRNIDDELILSKLEQAIRSIFAGSIAVGLVQGTLTAIGFAIFGVPNPILWGVIASMAALVPGIGTALVLIPAIAYLFISGSTGMAVGLLIWGIFAVGLVDNFLGPILVNRGVKIHPFLILLSVLGGIILFGPIGFVLGPLIIALLFALLELNSMHQSTSIDRTTGVGRVEH
ncbi:MAG TPA: AI-2E family transporter [Candidatus Paceibacterota bacterium]